MSEKRILLASLLKPVNEVRMYEKLGLSLCRLPQAQVHLCGFQAAIPVDAPPNIYFHPVFGFKRLHFGRAKAQWLYYRLLRRLKPHLIIACTHELLLPSMYYARRYKCKLVYDVQENYTLNLTAQHNYRPGLKHLMAAGVRSIENAAAGSIDHYLVAERSYLQDLPFLKQDYTLIENKYKPKATYSLPVTPITLPQGPLRLLYSGTISEIYGVFDAIAFADTIQQLRPGSTLTIIGYSPRKETWQKVKELATRKPYLHLAGGDKLVPHQQIVQQIQQSDVGLLPYQPNESTFRCIPTKLYEYMAHALPIIVQQNPTWHTIIAEHAAGLSINFTACNAAALLKDLQQQQFYTSGIPGDVYWNLEEQKLLQAINNLLI
ncbi:glycosyltransferase [Pontibacter sp. 172403-2]|uniref:glycosyltransferase n=1 Tax=Pontibacter rufus TaxID=2791028 RepID=UPI0018AF8C1F|nr:glycosyltransferase [Pontibacter sp. 172403-2]MBF9254751.1 glycosyltransferase [Pontibacter sp. 172403-2]